MVLWCWYGMNGWKQLYIRGQWVIGREGNWYIPSWHNPNPFISVTLYKYKYEYKYKYNSDNPFSISTSTRPSALPMSDPVIKPLEISRNPGKAEKVDEK